MAAARKPDQYLRPSTTDEHSRHRLLPPLLPALGVSSWPAESRPWECLPGSLAAWRPAPGRSGRGSGVSRRRARMPRVRTAVARSSPLRSGTTTRCLDPWEANAPARNSGRAARCMDARRTKAPPPGCSAPVARRSGTGSRPAHRPPPRVAAGDVIVITQSCQREVRLTDRPVVKSSHLRVCHAWSHGCLLSRLDERRHHPGRCAVAACRRVRARSG
jgi:hypothetical protein